MSLDTVNNLISLDDAKVALGQYKDVAQVVDVLCGADIGGAKYFLISSINDDYYVWFDVDDGSVDPAVADRTGIEVDVSDDDTALTIATALAVAMEAETDFSATRYGRTVRITNAAAGTVTEATAGDTGWTVTTQVEGHINDTTSDDLLNDLINQASWYLNGETHRELKSRSQTEYHDGTGGYELWLRHPPISTVTLYQDSDRAFAAATEISSDDYVVYEDMGKLWLTGDSFLYDRYVIKVTYTGGYSTIPYDLQRACRELVAQGYELLQHHAYSGERSNEAGVTNYRLDDLPNVKAAIRRYRKDYIL